MNLRVTRRIIVLVIMAGSLIGFSACAKSTSSETVHVSSSASRKTLSAQDAALLAARLANEKCDRQYQKRPFRPEQHPAILQDGLYHWGNPDVGAPGGLSASVTFHPDGSEPRVEVYFSSDSLVR